MESIAAIMDTFSQWAIPLVILVIILCGYRRQVPLYETFVVGAKEGFGVAVMIIPYLVAMLFVIKVFLASGIFDDLTTGAGNVLAMLGLDEYTDTLELLPLALTRPLTGSGARGVMLEIFDRHGPDSFLGNTATLIMGSTETTFYIATVYFGAVQVTRLRHTIPACLLADLAGITTAVVLGFLLYR
jgi:spore maturation protein B